MKNPPVTSYSMVIAESFSSKIRNKTRMPTLTTFIQHNIIVLEGLAPGVRQKNKKIKNKMEGGRKEGRKKGHPFGKGRYKIVTICR